ncbi:hypothetical protein D9V30_00100 [Mycetocola reblochoni]|uniref:Phage capsid and scaffold \|nr:hypothetical protein [Mycetocola reblochoni]RLP70875.1 hypothetical protein D9V30_00100 [Mycetocola reblochoni]SJN20879.1 Phage capsid and scaffold \
MSDVEAPAEGVDQAESSAQNETDWKSEARKWESRAKANKDAAEELAAVRESQKSEAEKAADRLKAAEARLAEFEARDQRAATVREVAAATGLDEAAVSVLAGGSADELTAAAEVLKPLISARQAGPVVKNAGDQPDHKSSPESEFLSSLFSGASN